MEELTQNVFMEELLLASTVTSTGGHDWPAAAVGGGGGGGGAMLNYEQLLSLPHHHQWWANLDPFNEDLTMAPPPDHDLLTSTGLLLVTEQQQSPSAGGGVADDEYFSSNYYPFLEPLSYSTSLVAPEATDDLSHTTTYPFVDATVPSLMVDQDALLAGCKVEEAIEQLMDNTTTDSTGSFSMGCSGSDYLNTSNNCKRNGVGLRPKRIEGQPSKNLMAERRRRKRLNDRLSMLRSIVPKISKMDRTSILGDTIDYMKELLERINKLKDEDMEVGTSPLTLMGFTRDLKKPNDVLLVRNSPKFEVERTTDMSTRIDICCATRPGLLLSTVNTLEALGVEIQQCVISCFNDFSMQASCSEVTEESTVMSPEDIKQALFRNAGYGGRCL